MRQISLVSLVALSLLTVSTSSALAQQADPAARSAAVALYDAAEQLSAQKNFAAACPKYAESYRLDHQLGALLHLADCLEKNGQFASAYGSFRESIELAESLKEDRLKIATDRAKALEPRLNKLIVEVPPQARVPGLEVLRDGMPLAEGSWGIAIPIDSGAHVIEARAPGYVPFRSTLTIDGEGRQEVMKIGSLTAAPAEPAKPPEPGILASSKDPGAMQRNIGWIVGGVGVLGVGAGIAFQLQKGNRLSDRDSLCPSGSNCEAGTQVRIDQLTADAKTSQRNSLLAFVGGGLGVGVGVALILLAPKAQPSGRAALQLTPIVGPNLAGLVTTQTF